MMIHASNDHPIASTDRAMQLLAAIKNETRWLVLASPVRSFDIDESGYAEDRATLLCAWPIIRNRRLPSSFYQSFYDLAADHASLFARLIEIRKQRNFNRKIKCL